MKIRITLVIFIAGVVSIIAQTLIIREGLTLFAGNELVSGLLLSIWFIATGLGSFIFSKVTFSDDPNKNYSILILVLSVLFLFAFIFVRSATRIFSIPLGEAIGLGRLLVLSLVGIGPVCLFFGGLFPAASKAITPQKVYFLEAAGSFVGGLVMSFLLIQIIPASGIALIAFSLLLFCGFLLCSPKLAVFSIVPLLIFLKINDVEFSLRKVQTSGQELIGVRESRYGIISVTRTGSQTNFYVNGVYDFSYPDLYNSEEAVHYAMLFHPLPQKVLLIGGGIGNCVAEILKHPDVRELTYLELDPVLFALGERFIRKKTEEIKSVSVVFGDARYYIKGTSKIYDVVIINLPDPVNGQINRFYTREFFNEAKRILEPGGVLSVRISSPPDIISPLHAQLLKTVYNTLSQSFEDITVLPCAKATFLAVSRRTERGENPVQGHEDLVSLLIQRLKQRKLSLMYVNEYFINYNLTRERLDYLMNSIQKAKAGINTDLKPACYYYSIVLWARLTSDVFRGLLVRFAGLNRLFFILPLMLVFLFFRHRSIVYLSVFSIGASAISIEVILIILFQAFHGYLYGWIGAIIASFMLGLASGSYFCASRRAFFADVTRMLSMVELLVAFYIGIMVLVSISNLPANNLVIPILLFFAGFLAGYHFPLAIKVMGAEKSGVLYGIDLFGASLGAIMTSVVLIPIFGVVFTLVLYLLLNLVLGFGLLTVKGRTVIQ